MTLFDKEARLPSLAVRGISLELDNGIGAIATKSTRVNMSAVARLIPKQLWNSSPVWRIAER
jgi:hypothetical protein